MVDEGAIRAAPEAVDPERVLAFARSLIAARSENPGGTEAEAAKVAEGILSSLGVEPQLVEAEPGRTSVVAAIGSGRPKLAWNGHLDVVPAGDPEEWPHPPFDGDVEGGRLWGRGSADMKGAIGAALAAVDAIRRSRIALEGTLELHLVADEEHSGIYGTKVLFERGLLDSDVCVVGEPSGLDLGLAQRGGAWLRAVSHGVAAHGSRPHLGVNAISSMARFVLALQEVLPDRSHPLVGSPTVNVGTIAGGRARNMVPDRCEIEIDRRIIPGESREEILGPFDRLVARLRSEHADFDLDYEVGDWTEAAETPAGAPIVALAREAVRDHRGTEPRDVGFTGITDARFYINGAGIPAVLLGPGDLALAHTSNESVEVEELVAAARIYAGLFVRFLGA